MFFFRNIVVAASISLLAAPLFGQQAKTVERHGVSWNRYYLTWAMRPRWVFHQEIDYRFLTQTGAWHQLITHTHLHRQLGETTEVSAGFSRSETGAVSPDRPAAPHRLEWRFFQEMHLAQALGARVRLQHRYRLEQRFFKDNPTQPFTWRGRYRVQLTWPVASRWTLKAADEIMVNWGRYVVRNTFDQNRIYVGLEYAFSKQIRAEIGYMSLWQQSVSGDLYYLRDVGRVSVYQRF
jgi:hypothetical protein